MFGRLIKFGNSSGDPGASVTLSLYLLLLAFFIMLNAFADKEEAKAEAVLESINSSFSEEATPENPTPENPTLQLRYEKLLNKLGGKNQVADDLGRLFEEIIPVVEVAWGQNQDKLRLALPMDRVFPEKSREMSPQLDVILQRFLFVLSQIEEDGVFTELSLLYGLEKRQTLESRSSLVTKRLDHVVSTLESHGYPHEQISVGLLPLKGQYFYFDLYLYQKAPEVLSFHDEVLR